MKNKIVDAISKGTLPQTILFHGPDDNSIVELVSSFAFDLIKPKRDISNDKFVQLCMQQHHPDFILIVKGDTGSTKIEEIQALDNTICYLPFESENRIVFIKDGGSLTLQAQNALLKKIEEPPARTYFIISSRKRNSLLPTILSRSVSIFVPPLKSESGVLTPFDFFPFLKTFKDELGNDFVNAEKKKMELEVSATDMNSMVSIDKLAETICDVRNLSDKSKNEITAEKAEYIKRIVIRMRLAFFSFYLKNQQYFSMDASVFYNLIGEDIGKEQ